MDSLYSPLNIILADEHVIIESVAENAGAEIRSESGFLLGYRETGEVPLTGKIINYGQNVPVEFRKGTVMLPPGAHMLNVPDPQYLSNRINKNESRKLCVTHYKNIKVIYKDL